MSKLFVLSLVTATVIVLGTCGRATAQTPSGSTSSRDYRNLDEAMASVAADVSKRLVHLGQSNVVVGPFLAPHSIGASSGPGIEVKLTKHLESRKIKVAPLAKYAIRGEYRMKVRKDQAGTKTWVAVEIMGQLIDPDGSSHFVFAQQITNQEFIAEAGGLTVELPPSEPAQKRRERLAVAIEQPSAPIRGSVVYAGPDSPYGMEILIKSGKQFVPMARGTKPISGMAFVSLEQDQEYAIRLINKSEHDAAVRVGIDGLSVFAFSKHKSYRHLIIRAGSSGIVKGWHRTNESSDAFKISRLADTPAAKLLHDTSGVGVITSIFSAAWDPNRRPPSDEYVVLQREQGIDTAEQGVGTGRGSSVDAPYEALRRRIGIPRATVSIRYSKNR